METRQHRDIRTILACLFIFALFMANVILWRDIWQGSKFLIVFFDIGQGDSIFMKTPWGHTILVDGGPDMRVGEKLGRYLSVWDRKIDLMVLTHPEKDHMFGLIGILKHVRVDTVFWTGVRRSTRGYRAFEAQLQEEKRAGTKVVLAKAPQKIFWTRGQAEYFDVISPTKEYAGKFLDLSNESGIVARLVLPGHSVLLTADIPSSVEMELVKSGAPLASEVLKVAHHGSRNSSAPEFLQAVGPSVAVISSGKDNTYGHPHQETLAKLQQYGIQIRRTDEEGDIKFLFQ